MPFPTSVDALVDAPPLVEAARIKSSQVLGPQRITVGPLLLNTLSDIYQGNTTVAAKVTAAAADSVLGNANGLIVIPPLSSGMSAPPAPTVTVQGVAGSTTYIYMVIAINSASDAVVSGMTTVTNGNATLSATNFNAVSWSAVVGATSYKLVRIFGAPSGVVFTGTATSFNDQGGTVTSYQYPGTINFTGFSAGSTFLDQRYLPTNQAANITRNDATNGFQTSSLKFGRRFDAGADNGATLIAEAFLTGGSGSVAGPDGEAVAFYAGSVRTGGTRSMWATNFFIQSNVAISAAMTNVGLEIDVNNNGGVDATTSTSFDGIGMIAGGNAKSRYGMVLFANPPGGFFDGINIAAGSCTQRGIRIQPGASASGIGIECNQHIVGGGSVPLLGALQTNVSSQSISGSDNRMNVSITSGATGPAQFATIALVTYAVGYASTPFTAMVQHDTAGGYAANVYLSVTTATGFQPAMLTAMGANQTVQMYFLVIG